MLNAAKLAANARPFRYVCYPVIAGGFLLLDGPGFWPAAAVLLWCLLWPLCVDLGQRRASAAAILRVHLLEAALTCLLLAWAGVNASLVCATAIVLVASNAMQGGIRHALLAALCAGTGAAAGGMTALCDHAISTTSTQDLPGVAAGGMAAFCGGSFDPEGLESSMASRGLGMATPWGGWFDLPAAAVFSWLLVLAYCALLGHRGHIQALIISRKRAQLHVMNTRLKQYLPHTLAERLHEMEEPHLERRWLVVTFVDLAGFTPLVEQLQTEELTTVLDDYLKTLTDVTESCGGSVSKMLGDGAMLVFGEAGPAERRRLVADALQCCRQLSAELTQLAGRWRDQGMPASLRLKAGMASGFCSLGDWGGGGRLEYTVIGHPVNLASRLENLAGADEILLCERTSLLADIELSPTLERPVKGLGPVRYQKADCCAPLPCPPSPKPSPRIPSSSGD